MQIGKIVLKLWGKGIIMKPNTALGWIFGLIFGLTGAAFTRHRFPERATRRGAELAQSDHGATAMVTGLLCLVPTLRTTGMLEAVRVFAGMRRLI